MKTMFKLLSTASSLSVMMLCAVPALAGGTAPGTEILNSVTVDYQTGSVMQTAITVADTLKVDRKIMFSIVEWADPSTTSVPPGATDMVARFRLTNTSNDTLDFSLAVLNQALSSAAAHGGQTSFQLLNTRVVADDNNSGTYSAGSDTATFINNLGPDESWIIFVVGDIPSTATNDQIAGIRLEVTAREIDGSPITASTDSDANGANTVETVFADSEKSGIAGISAARDGIEVVTDDFTVSAPELSVFKNSRVVSDGVSESNFKFLPGAVVEYCISVTNAPDGAAPNNILVSDIIPAAMTYEAGTIRINATVTDPGPNQICTLGTEKTDNEPDADGGRYSATRATVVGQLNGITAGVSKALIFRAKIN